MGYLIEDKNFINDNIFKFEKRLESQYTIFTDKTPTFVTYYHINNINSITDTGLLNVEKIFGKDSPLRFQEIKDFPIYGIESIKLDLSDEEEGLNGSFEGEGIILPNTVKPLPNDFFTISYLDKTYIFMVTSIDYDTIKSNNFYKINYYLRTDSEETFESAQEQVLEKYSCVFRNIGTEDKCLIKDDEYALLNKLNEIYTRLVEKYIILFYSEKFNSILFADGQNFIYDKYLTHFINSNQLLNKKEEYRTFMMSNEDWTSWFTPEYDACIYTAIEDCNIDALEHTKCMRLSISYMDSVFKHYNMTNVQSINFIDTGTTEYIDSTIIDNIKHNSDMHAKTALEKLIIGYFNEGIESIYNIDINSLDTYKVGYIYSDFILVPVALFILRHYFNKFMIS